MYIMVFMFYLLTDFFVLLKWPFLQKRHQKVLSYWLSHLKNFKYLASKKLMLSATMLLVEHADRMTGNNQFLRR